MIVLSEYATFYDGVMPMCSEAQMCCGQVADKAQLLLDELRVVEAFDGFAAHMDNFGSVEDVEKLEKAFKKLGRTVDRLRT